MRSGEGAPLSPDQEEAEHTAQMQTSVWWELRWLCGVSVSPKCSGDKVVD